MESIKIFDFGNRVSLVGNFTNENGGAADPTTVVVMVRKPTGAITVYNDATNPSVGEWRKTIDLDEEGRWTFRFEGTGVVKAAKEEEFVVNNSPFYD